MSWIAPVDAIRILENGSDTDLTVTVFLAPRHAAEIASLIEHQENTIACLEASVELRNILLFKALELMTPEMRSEYMAYLERIRPQFQEVP